ncbi:elongation factor P hydroxylase [Halomonas sp. GD1P12]|uniref:elongation factor P hydroxylase n=1 Tax=Halomonas sp. GD1P12 TaxID=2982691 RepID=UPI0021E3F47E|nr:elongation factor P hydroxylase [Halomonas sp. GD1P12]UYG01132.1 elongation factor P hydroxylase [Halomonas sp. GD1P12]
MTKTFERWTLADIIALFDGVFADTYQTRLIKGGDEPLYLPATSETPYHQVIFARGFFASALHEISHWCIAGAKRREQEDYGYWYLPDGRDAFEQAAFERAEIAPQALEYLFTRACGRAFNVSVDNLGGAVEVDRAAFEAKVLERAARFERDGLPLRARAFRRALSRFYQQGDTLDGAVTAGLEALGTKTPNDKVAG